MSTQINVTVGSGGLSDKAKQLQAAARQAQLEKERTLDLSAEALDKRIAAQAAKGLSVDGKPLYSVPTQLPEIERRPAANRSVSTIVNGVGVKITYSTLADSGLTDYSVKVELGAVNGTQATEFVYPYRSLDASATPAPSGFPSTWDDLPPTIGSLQRNNLNQITSISFPGSHFFQGDVAASAFDPSGGSYTVTTDISTGNLFTNLSRVFALPDGRGNTYIIFVLNRLYRRRFDRLTKTAVATPWQLIDTQEIAAPVVIEGITQLPIQWSGNPGCYIGFLADISPETVAQWESQSRGRIYIGKQRLDSTREPIVNQEFSDYGIHLYKVTRASATELTVPPALDTWMRQICPPVSWNGEVTISTAQTVIRTDVQNPGYFEVDSSQWDGSYGSGCFPNQQQQTTQSFETVAFVYPTFTSATYFNTTTAYNPDFTSLLFTLGGAGASLPRAFGPSFALSYNKDVKALTFAQGRDYDYMENVFFEAKPKQYVAKCVLPGSCPGDLATSSLDVTWYQSKTRPPAYDQIAPVSSYSPVQKGAYVTAAHLRTGFTIYWVTNWGSNALCRGILSPLGL